uniref:protein CPR-5 n=1 Tax=Erigeron canadensis TaxID=72917 RepID=UPI001CB9D479|nr:protein CPR-5 [Erigeron canadensis]
MEPPPPIPSAVTSTADPNSGDSNPPTKPKNPTTIINKKNKKKILKPPKNDIVSDHPQQQSSSSSSCSVSKGFRISRKNPKRVFTQRSNGGEADALALPLGMSIAAFVAKVLEKKDLTGEKMSVNHLSEICTLAVKESLSNVFGDKFDCFISNFERSFQSTLMTLRVISESSGNRERPYPHGEESSSNFHFDIKENASTSREQTTIGDFNEHYVHRDPPIYNQLVLHDSKNVQQLTMHSGLNRSMSTIESLQARSNELKELELSLTMKKMKLKEAQIAVDCDSNILERFKLSMGISKANFKSKKFKTELQDSRHAELLKSCVDYLVSGMLIMVTCLLYGTYTYSHQRLVKATESCKPVEESGSWWIPKPMTSFSTGFQTLRCQVQVVSRMLFGILMIIAVTYLFILRRGSTTHTMPVTFILLLLGCGCGFAGKFCIDTLGGSGYLWLFYWWLICSVHFVANMWTSMLFIILHGPLTVTNQSTNPKLFSYRTRQFMFCITMTGFLPLLCGLMPFAGLGDWLEHFTLLMLVRDSE